MRRAATWAPWGDFWVPILEARICPAKDWRDIAGRCYCPTQFLDDLRPSSNTVRGIANALEQWALGEGNYHPDTDWDALAGQLQNDVADAAAEGEE